MSISLHSVSLNLQHWGLPLIVAGGQSHKEPHNVRGIKTQIFLLKSRFREKYGHLLQSRQQAYFYKLQKVTVSAPEKILYF